MYSPAFCRLSLCRSGPTVGKLGVSATLLLAMTVRFALPVAAESLPTTPTDADLDFFEARIRPVLVEHCYKCHSAETDSPRGGLRVDSAAGLRRGGDSGPAIVAGEPNASLLVSALRYESRQMPPSGKLSERVIARFEQWIARGAADPRTEETGLPAEEEEVFGNPDSHWAFQPPARVSPPPVSNAAWPRSEIDHYVLSRLEQAGLPPSPAASPRVLLRRLHHDLTGLPPTAEELEAFEANFSEQEYASAVDRLLASPRFGERWARHWLDVARYANTKGYVFQESREYPNAYKYRDWVIESFNQDRPYDQFVLAQLAADQLDDAELTPAMGFLTLGRRFLNNRHDIIDDRIDLVTRGLMGLTATCARCHDHKYDPIPTADYYSLYGVFASSQEKTSEENPPMLVDAEKPVDPVVFLRGNPSNRGPSTPRQFLSCVEADGEQPFQHGSGRLEMARAIACAENPLTARVWVNRVWAHLIGHPLVRTPSDFGLRGDRPTHPDLLDWLACSIVEDGWSTKRLVRRIVLSSTYRQASGTSLEAAEADPANELLSHMNRRRLDLETCRDSLLSAAGELDLAEGGPAVKLTEPPYARRRAVYGLIERQNLPAFFRTFDFANPNTHTPERPKTVSPQQAIYFMNSPFVMQQACALAERTEPAEDAQRVRLLFRYALGRNPGEQELAEALEFIAAPGAAASSRESEPAPLDAWQLLAQTLLMSNEFMFVD